MAWADLPLIRSAPGSYLAGGNGPVTRIVWHRMEAPMRRGTARGTANYFAAGSGGNYVSAHVCVDPGEAVRCLDLADMGYHAPPNGGSIGVELAGYSADDDWHTEDGESMLRIAANVGRDIAAELGVDPVWLVASSLLAGRHGHTSHAEVSNAWHQSDHWDPGPYFPVDHFLDLVRGGPAPAPSPPVHQEDDDMNRADTIALLRAPEFSQKATRDQVAALTKQVQEIRDEQKATNLMLIKVTKLLEGNAAK